MPQVRIRWSETTVYEVRIESMLNHGCGNSE